MRPFCFCFNKEGPGRVPRPFGMGFKGFPAQEQVDNRGSSVPVLFHVGKQVDRLKASL